MSKSNAGSAPPSDQTVDELKDTLGQAADLVRTQAARADELVRANPYVSIGIAAGVGLLAGYLLTRNCCSQD